MRRRRILVYCGGARTEPDYFEGLRGVIDRSVAVDVRYKAVSPGQLVASAARVVRRDPDRYDEIWCVVDVDEFDIEDAGRHAARLNVNLAISNPCFEFWLLLHHTDHQAPARHCREMVQQLRRYVPHYDKALDFASFVAGTRDAIRRARALSVTGEDWRRSPSTGVWRLVERIVGKE